MIPGGEQEYAQPRATEQEAAELQAALDGESKLARRLMNCRFRTARGVRPVSQPAEPGEPANDSAGRGLFLIHGGQEG